MATKASKAQRNILYFLFFCLLLIGTLFCRVAWVQFVDGKKLVTRAQTQLRDQKELQSPRGTIFDRNGRELAVSTMTKSLYASPVEVGEDIDRTAELLAPVIDVPVADIKERLKMGGSFVWLKRTLDAPVAEKVINLKKENNLKGLHFVEESKRYYPSSVLASNILGFVGTDDKGLNGIEMVFDKKIKGQLIKQQVETDSYGKPIFNSIFTFIPTKQGKSIYLTIDSTIQFIVEEALDKAMQKTKSKAGTVIIMNPKTGEILAMASRPTYNPNTFYRYSNNEWKNRAVSIIYEPGSTFKSIIAAAALEEGVVSPEERFVDTGNVEVSGRRIKNWSGESYGNISFTDIIKNSINTGFVQVGLRLGAEKLNKYAKAFGFGKVTDIDLPGEESGILFNTKDMRDSDVATMAIGQSIAVTPLQLLTAVCSIANEGVLLKPYIVKEIINADGTPDMVSTTQVIRQAISKDTAEKLKLLLEKVVSEGGGSKAAVKGYRFAGKTGTAEKLSESGSGYEAGKYIASFVGFGPVEDPQLAALVVLDSPQGIYYGGQVAAPVFQDIMTKVVRYLNMPPESVVSPIPKLKVNESPAKVLPPSTVIKVGPGKVVVPNVIGKTIREAGELITNQGLIFIPLGSGVAVSQTLLPNSVVNVGMEIKVYFEHR